MVKHSHSLSFLLIIAVAYYILSPFEHPWFPQTADGEYYAARLANFYTAMLEGSIPPRWAPSFYSGLGYPVFNFNYPLPNLLGTLIISLGSTIQTALKGTIIISYLAAGLGMYWLLYLMFRQKSAALFGALLYLTAPYHIHDIFHRATTGELMMFGLLPFVLIALVKTTQNQLHPTVMAFVAAAYFLTHNLYTLLMLPLVIGFIYFNLGAQTYKHLLLPVAAGLLMSLFFWIPALAEMKYTVLPVADINQGFHTKLYSLLQTIKLPGLYEPKRVPPTLDSDQPGFAQLFIATAAVMILLISGRKISKNHRHFALFGLAAVVVGLFAMNHTSLPLWQVFNFSRFIQHPIRLLFIPVFFGAYLGAFVVTYTSKKLIVIATAAVLTAYNYTFFAYRPVNYVPFEDSFFYHYPLTSAANNEFDPIWYDRVGVNQYFLDTEHQEYITASPSAQLTVLDWGPFARRYRVIAQAPTTSITEKTLYFPGWQTTVNGQPIDIDAHAGRRWGLINYDLPPGQHEISTSFTQNTPARNIAHVLSISGLVLALSLGRKKSS